ncbi:MAG: MgtC/SapB family protein [Pseudorhodoplanes sp.]|nr:MgtC/SapB family protein [Pseudorhodoplanes sp.]
MDLYDTLSRLTVSLAIGMLVGLERGWRTRDEEDRQRAAGFRTFALSGLLGGVTGALSERLGGEFVGLIFIGYAAAFTAFHWLQAQAERNLSVTSVVAGMLTFLLGALSTAGDLRIAIACAVVMALLLALRETLHRWIASLTWPEIRSILILLAMSFLLLPILPDRTVDPWDAINPHEIWLLAILIAAISFGGYVAVRIFGDRLGIILTAIAGGLASSTATTLAFARLGHEQGASSRLLSAGILISGATMMVRVGALAAALNRALLPTLAPPLASAAVILAGGAFCLLAGKTERQPPKLHVDNPLALGTALKLAAFIAFVLLCVAIVRPALGNPGVFVLGGISGLADVDAVTIAMARLGRGEVGPDIAAQAVLIAVAVNTGAKAVLAGWTGGRPIGLLVGTISALALAAGLVASVTLNWSVGA